MSDASKQVADKARSLTNEREPNEKHQFDPRVAGFSLMADEKTLHEIESAQDEVVKAAHGSLKFAFR